MPVGDHVFATGSYSSPLLKATPPLFAPPATSTLPLDSSVDVWKERAVLMLAATVQVPMVGS